MPELWTPQSELEATAEYEVERIKGRMSWFLGELKKLDSRLGLIYIKPGSTVFPKSPRWAITRKNELTLPSYWIIEDENGNFCEPDQRHLDRMHQMDAAKSKTSAAQILEDERRRVDAEKRAAKEETSREFREKLLDRLNHIYDPRISVPKDIKGNG